MATPSNIGNGDSVFSADDFVLTRTTWITDATFTGLLTGGVTSADVVSLGVVIFSVFPADSDVTQTSGPPTFSTPQVPTRVGSPSDDSLDSRSTSASELTFTANELDPSFTALNSILGPGGIHPKPNQTTGGDGSLMGSEVMFVIDFTQPIRLGAGHYFFVPLINFMVSEEPPPGEFFWLSAAKPIVAPGTPFPAGKPDLQSWIRSGSSGGTGISPDWLRIGTDIVGGNPAPTFNAAFSLNGVVSEPGSLVLVGAALSVAAALRRRIRKVSPDA